MRHAAKKTNGFETGKDEQRRKLRAAIAKRVNGDAALSRRRKIRFEGGLPRHPARFAPLRLLFQKVLRYFLGALLICSVYSFWRALVFGARARSARVTARRQPRRQLRRRLVSRQAHVILPFWKKPQILQKIPRKYTIEPRLK